MIRFIKDIHFRKLTPAPPRPSPLAPRPSIFTALLVALPLAGSAQGVVREPLPSSPPLYLNGETLHPLPLSRSTGDTFNFLKAGQQTALIQFTGPIRADWKAQAAASGVRLRRYIPDFGYVASGSGTAFRAASRLPFVRWIGPYRSRYRISEGLPETGPTAALVALEADALPDLFLIAARVQGLRAQPAGAGLVRIAGDAGAVRRLAERDEVRWIGPVLSPQLMNDRSRVLIGANTVWSDLGLYGEGQTVGIIDTGLDSGDTDTLSDDFKGRIAEAFALAEGGDWADQHGHGTHVAGAIVGQGKAVEGLPDPESFAGVAPRAKLVVQAFEIRGGYAEGLPEDLNALYSQAYEAGARIHNNSWGDDFTPYGGYSLHSSQTDEFIWKHPDMTIVFAAGNDGSDSPTRGSSPLESRRTPKTKGNGIVLPGSLYAPGTAKNAISVGASEGNRPVGEKWGGFTGSTWRGWGFQSPPLSVDYVSDQPQGITAFSSRGPAADGRIKPDLVSPGSNIISPLSQSGAASHMWGPYGVGYAFNGGSSIATGFVSGSAALVRQWYEDRQGLVPSAALVKATLLNASRELAPGQYGTDAYREIPERPNGVEGWGRVDVGTAIAPPAPLSVGFTDEKSGLHTEGRRSWLLRVTEPGQPLRIMLAWTDYPGAPDAAVALVNDLDLTVTAPDGVIRRGNDQEDRRNNVEAVNAAEALPGVYRVTVNAYNVPEGPQPFALVTLGASGRLLRPGDLNGDRKVAVEDVILALRASVGLAQLTEDERLAGDVTQAGTSAGQVDVSDAIQMLRVAVGLEEIVF